MTGVGEWRIHLGAHKTATTHLQETLSVMPETLRGQGIAYLESYAVRPILHDLGSWRPSRWLMGREAEARRLGTRLAALAGDGPPGLTVALSDETILGSMIEALRPRPYPRLARRVRSLAALARDRPLTLFLSIRSFDRVLPGAYATALRTRRLSPLVLRRRDRIFDGPPRRWTEVLDRIARAAPGLRVRVWRQEDYRADPKRFIVAFLGRDGLAIPDREPPRTTVTPSAEAIAEVEALIREGVPGRDPGGWQARVNQAYAERPARTDTPFRPIGAAAVARHLEAYEADLAAIRRDRPGWLIEP